MMTEIEAMETLEELHRALEYYYAENDCYPKGFDDDTVNALDEAMRIFSKYRKYSKLGSAEECKDAIEKQKAKRPKNFTITQPKRPIYKGNCPTCFSIINLHMNYCQTCGQALDLSPLKSEEVE